MTDKERYLRANEIFHAALSLEGNEREAYLARACAGDDLLMREVRKLLAGDERADSKWELAVGAKVAEQFAAYQSDADRSLVGETINNRYLVEAKLGEGGIGVVYKAIDTRVHSRFVAIKLLLNASNENEYLVNKFHHEGESLARIKHPGVVSVYDIDALPDGRPFIVMEYVEGEALDSLIKPTGMNLAHVAKIMQQVGQALSAAHREGVIHRDLKPANIMLQALSDGSKQAKIIDFGIAKVANPKSADATQARIVSGTIQYMAMEQIRTGEGTISSDIYSLGIIAYEMVTGQLPFITDWSKSDAHYDLVEKQREGVKVKPKTLRPELSDAAQDVILKSLSNRLEERQQSADEFGEQLEKAIMTGSVQRPSKVKTLVEPSSSKLEELWKAAKFTDKIWPLLASQVQQDRAQAAFRGLGGAQKKIQYTYPLGSRLCIAVDLKEDGYLMMLDEGTEGVIYCLCPSWFAPDTRLKKERSYLPQPNSYSDAFELQGKLGRERLLAIITDEPLELGWMPKDLEMPARELNQEDFEMLLDRLHSLEKNKWIALRSYFDVIA